MQRGIGSARSLRVELLVALTALAVCAEIGCGPIVYVTQVTRKASASVAAAKAARADRYSPYWYTLAVEYLHKAREEASYADYEAANRFGRKAHQAAEKAKDEAIARAANPSDEAWLPPPGLREKPPDDSEKLAPADGLAPADTDGGLAPAITDEPPKAEPKAEPEPKNKGKKGKKGKSKRTRGKK